MKHLAACVLCLLSCWSLLSCQQEERGAVNLSDLEDAEVRIGMEEAFDTVRYIELKTDGNFLLGNPNVYYMDDRNILVLDGNQIYRFDGDGNFLNRIGAPGHGHGEYGMVTSLTYDSLRNAVVASTLSKQILQYEPNGTFIDSYNLTDDTGRIMAGRWSPSLGMFVYETREYQQDGVEVYLQACDAEGKRHFKELVYTDNETVKSHLFRDGSLRETAEGMLFMLPFDDKVFLADRQGVSQCCVLNRGSRTPTRKLIEEPERYDDLFQSKYMIEGMVATPRRFYLSLTGMGKQRDVIVERATSRIIHNQHYKPGDNAAHFRLGDSAGTYSFWPSKGTGNIVYQAVILQDLDKRSAEFIRRRLPSPSAGQPTTAVVIACVE